MKTVILREKKEDLIKGADIIKNGGLVAFPTETVYGLGADAKNSNAVGKVYEAKGRPQDNPMIVHIANFEELYDIAETVTPDMIKMAKKFWPGPMTMIVRNNGSIPEITTGGLETVGVRLPDNITARTLIQLSNTPIAAPSANISGRPSPTRPEHVKRDLEGKIDAIIWGKPCEVGIESTVIDMTQDKPMILRPGGVTRETIEKVVGRKVLLDPYLNKKQNDGTNFTPKAPGMKYRHYAPKASIVIYEGSENDVDRAIEVDARRMQSEGKKVKILLFETPVAAMRTWFDELRKADDNSVDVILTNALPEEGLGFSVMNRMLKSSGFNIKKV